MSDRRVAEAVERGLGHLAGVQDEWGEMPTLSWIAGAPGEARREHSPFVTTFVLYSLGFLPDGRLDELRQRARTFLAEEATGPCLWRFGTSRGEWSRLACDVDDTCCASFALKEVHPQVAWGVNVGLLLAHRDPAGRFYTWMATPLERNDVDVVVNANALLYLGERPETAGCVAYVNEVFARGPVDADRPYYPTDAMARYAVTRAFREGVAGLRPAVDAAVASIRAGADEGDELCRALDLCSLVHAGERPDDPSSAVEALRATQAPDGSWPARPFFRDPVRVYGSTALTTAIHLEALAGLAGGVRGAAEERRG